MSELMETDLASTLRRESVSGTRNGRRQQKYAAILLRVFGRVKATHWSVVSLKFLLGGDFATGRIVVRTPKMSH